MQDKIYLLSVEEYKKYKKKIPHINSWWWLRSPGYDSFLTAFVFSGGSVDRNGYGVRNGSVAVRPALQISNLKSSDLKIGDRFVYADFPWIVIDNGLAIAEVPIDFRRFDAKKNDYEKSEVRKFLLSWLERRTKKGE